MRDAIITLALGSPHYYRMAIALMHSCYTHAGSAYEYFIFSDKENTPYFHVPEYIKIVKLSDKYLNSKNEIRYNSWFIKSQLLNDPILIGVNVLFLDSDCYVFANSFEKIFSIIKEHSIGLYGSYLPITESWGPINYVEVGAKAGHEVKNMWLNSGFIGRAADPLGLKFSALYQKYMTSYPYKPYIENPFWKAADEPYLATAYQYAYKTLGLSLPKRIPGPSPHEFCTTYKATLIPTSNQRPKLHVHYYDDKVYEPAIIHFLGGLKRPYYKKIVDKHVTFTTKGKVTHPYFSAIHIAKKVMRKLRAA